MLPLGLHGYYIKYFLSLRITYYIWVEPFNSEVHYSNSWLRAIWGMIMTASWFDRTWGIKGSTPLHWSLWGYSILNYSLLLSTMQNPLPLSCDITLSKTWSQEPKGQLICSITLRGVYNNEKQKKTRFVKEQGGKQYMRTC